MKYLMISNPGVAPVEAFTVLGVSSSRGDNTKIGQFGSGNKHGVLVLLRQGIDPVIYLGTDQLKFFTVKCKMQDTEYQQVRYTFDGVEVNLSMSLDFGALDWTDMHMALREFISNAIDQVGYDKITIDLVDSPSPISGCTSIFIPATPDIIKYFRSISDYFLHSKGFEQERVIKKGVKSPCRIYRKGVYVREIDQESLYNYNFQDDVSIDECRNMDNFNCRWHSMTYCLDHCPPEEIIRYIAKETTSLEMTIFDSMQLRKDHYSQYVKAWKDTYGEALLGSPIGGEINQFATNRGFKVVIPVSARWYTLLSVTGIKTTVSVIADSELNNKLQQPSLQMVQTFNDIWNILKDYDMTFGKEKPKIMAMRTMMVGNVETMGQYQDGVVMINANAIGDISCYVEEIGHHVTGAKDCTRDFQSWAFKVAGILLEKML